MIIDVIRQADSEHEIFFLLTAYLEAVRFGDSLDLLSHPVKELPLDGIGGVRERFEQLVAELDRASRNLNDPACAVLKEALHIFSTALTRLEALAGNAVPPAPERRKRDRRRLSRDAAQRPHLPEAQGEIRAD